jgi:hypothetical protein
MSSKEAYGEKFAASAELVWGKEALAGCRSLVAKTGEAVYDVDNAEISIGEEPATRNDPGRKP